MRTITIGTMTVMAFDHDVWKQERNIIRCTVAGADYTDVVELTYGDISAVYHFGANGTVDIDLTDAVRQGSGSVTLEHDSASGTVDWVVAGLINPATMIIPCNYSDGGMYYPSWMPMDIGIPTAYEIYGFSSSGGVICHDALGEELASSNNARQMSFPANTAIVEGWFLTSDDTNRHLDSLDASKKYATVQWVSRSGIIKRIPMEIRKNTIATDDKTEYLNIHNSYDVRKGQVESVELYIPALDVYDYWYYSDIVTSSDVRVAMSTSDWDSVEGTIREECKVEVTAKSITIPDGYAGELNDLVIPINLKRYDEI